MMLNVDDLVNIFTYLSPEELGKVSQVCVLWKEAADTSSLWKRHCMEKWSFCNLASIPGERTWKTYFITRLRLEKSMETGRPGRDYSCKTLRGHSSPINDVVYVTSNEMYNTSIVSGDVSPIIASCGKNVQLWNVRDGKCIYKYEHINTTTQTSGTGHTDETVVRYLTFDNNHSWLASADSRGFVHIIDVKALTTVCTLNTETDIGAIIFGANPFKTKPSDTCVYLYVLARGGHFQLWDIKFPDSPVHQLDCGSLLGSQGIIETNNFCHVALSSNHASFVEVFDLRKLEPQKYTYNVPSPHVCSISKERYNVACLKWHPLKHNVIIIGYTNGQIILWDIAQGGVKMSSFSAGLDHRNSVKGMETEGKYLIITTSYGELQLLDIENERLVILLNTFSDHVGQISGLFVDRFRVLTCSEDFSIRVYKWGKVSDSVITRSLESRFTLLGGSLQHCGKGFKKVICDLSTCVGLADNNTLKAYTFKM